ncbi:MAG: sigma-54 dependent transcriptional regulator [Acidobacteriota bacterium]|nr:sigma-54 dependent transcriptional regulator [Acidobacteriota bacterium]
MILIVDDDDSVCTSLALLLKQAGYRTRSAHDPGAALDRLSRGHFQLVLQDMNFSRNTSGEEGLALLARIKREHPQLPVILMTAWGSISLAVKGIQAGASEFITKPWTHEQILVAVKTVLGLTAAGKGKGERLSRAQLDRTYHFDKLIGEDPKFLEILELIGRVAPTEAPVLLTGESGTGKELIAEALHRNSRRGREAFIKVNLGGMPVNLFESEMFGHVKGAFTDAGVARKGRFEVAHRGTIFLDEIGDLEASCQVKLLRVLQDRSFEPLGSSTSKTVDVRVISATNRPLHDMVAAGEFREDLLYRLNLIAVHLPALRERPGDIPLLADHFLKRIGQVYRKSNLSFSEQAVRSLVTRDWPGNVRQLKQTVERAVLISGRDVLEPDDFQFAPEMSAADRTRLPPVGSMTLEQMERAMVEDALKYHDRNISRVAESLGLSRAALYRRLEKYGIEP